MEWRAPNKEERELIGSIIREYLKSKYDNWNEEDLVYDKWK